MRYRTKRNIVIFLVIVVLLWINFYNTDKGGKTTSLDLTIIIPHFEHFDHNIVDTVKEINLLYFDIPILIVSNKTPYPLFKLPHKNSRFVILKKDPRLPGRYSDPLTFIKTKHSLIIPDGTRIDVDLYKLLTKFKNSNNPLVAFPISNKLTSCNRMEIDLKRWSLKYFTNEKSVFNSCDSFNHDVALLIDNYILRNYTEPFQQPFFESFFIQTKFQFLKLHLINEVHFKLGKILFTDKHLMWKHKENLKAFRNSLYDMIGIKYMLNPHGVESWYGCTKDTPRCFSSVIDVPEYLHDRRWTPPCCLNALRITARHVFQTLEQANIKYWLEGGSLLGAERYADIIPWDYDVDIGIFMEDIKNFVTLSKVWIEGEKFIDHDGFVWERAHEGDFIRVQYSQVNHLHVDIFPFYEKNGIMTKDTWFKNHRQDMEFPSHYIKSLVQLRFVGTVAWAPNHHKDFLHLKFGQGCIKNPKYPFPEKLEDSHF